MWYVWVEISINTSFQLPEVMGFTEIALVFVFPVNASQSLTKINACLRSLLSYLRHHFA